MINITQKFDAPAYAGMDEMMQKIGRYSGGDSQWSVCCARERYENINQMYGVIDG